MEKGIVRRFRKEEHGVVQMEYVIIGCLIAAALTLAVVAFSRGVFRGSDEMGFAITNGSSEQLTHITEEYRKDQESDSIIAKLFHVFITGGKE